MLSLPGLFPVEKESHSTEVKLCLLYNLSNHTYVEFARSYQLRRAIP